MYSMLINRCNHTQLTLKEVIRIKANPNKPQSSTSNTSSVKYSAANTTLTKKQKQNARKAEKLKAAKSEEQALQEKRLMDYRKNQERTYLDRLAKEDKEEERRILRKVERKVQERRSKRKENPTKGRRKGIERSRIMENKRKVEEK